MPLPLRAGAIVLLFLVSAGGARAGGSIRFENLRAAEGWLEVDLEVEGGLPPSVIETLGRGVPATVLYEVEIWRSRRRWFDRLEATQYLVYPIEFDAWDRVYRVRGEDGTVRELESLELLEAAVLRPSRIRVVPLRRLAGREPHYVAVRAGVKPLELEQIRRIEAWLEGKIPGEEESEDPGGGFLGIPERVFGFVASLAGFGEERLEARSVDFRPEGLE